MIKKWIEVTFQKDGIHMYPLAPEGVEFLRFPHRHMFYFRVKVEVFHDDRDIEFILFKRDLEDLYNNQTLQLDHKSCEMMADDVIRYIQNAYPGRDVTVSVFEDNENGAILEYTR